MIRVGKPAPDFKTKAYSNGEIVDVSLSDYRGKWTVLFFYPGDFTFVWTTEVTAVAEKYDIFQKLTTEVLAVSVDSPFVHKAWVDNELSKALKGNSIPYPMLSDQDGAISKAYGVYDEDEKICVRGVFVIDPDGIVQTYEVLTPPVGRNIFETLRQLKGAQHVREKNGVEALPAGWEPGKKTLKPSADLVGKVWEEWDVKDAFNK